MPRYTIQVEIECGEETCGDCPIWWYTGDYIAYARCGIYGTLNDGDDCHGPTCPRHPRCLASAQPVEDASVPVLILDDGSRIPLTGEIAELARKDASVPVLILADGRRLPLTEGVAEAAREACEEDGDE